MWPRNRHVEPELWYCKQFRRRHWRLVSAHTLVGRLTQPIKVHGSCSCRNTNSETCIPILGTLERCIEAGNNGTSTAQIAQSKPVRSQVWRTDLRRHSNLPKGQHDCVCPSMLSAVARFRGAARDARLQEAFRAIFPQGRACSIQRTINLARLRPTSKVRRAAGITKSGDTGIACQATDKNTYHTHQRSTTPRRTQVLPVIPAKALPHCTTETVSASINHNRLPARRSRL